MGIAVRLPKSLNEEKGGRTIEDTLVDEDLSALELIIKQRKFETLEFFFEDLDEFDGYCVRLYYFQDKTELEIGEILGISDSNVSQRLIRARKVIERKFKENDIDY